MTGGPMLIAQITDLHLGFHPGDPDEPNRRRLDRTLKAVAETMPQPDLLLVTGDLAEEGDDLVSYQALREALAALPFPVHFALGNHDSRAPFLEIFPDQPTADGFVQYAIEHERLRILVLDTLEEGRHGGNLCGIRIRWLAERLAEAPERPTLIVLHHPPVATGLSWMSENPDAPWAARLHAIVAARSNVVALVAGHLHRPIVTGWAGTMLIVCPSTAPQVALDLAPIDPEQPDGRPMIVADAPGFALHRWDGSALTTHFETAQDHEILAAFGPALQPLVRMLEEERARPV
jgi:3',5'-cyclic AMP phosphodiesterase CpdA